MPPSTARLPRRPLLRARHGPGRRPAREIASCRRRRHTRVREPAVTRQHQPRDVHMRQRPPDPVGDDLGGLDLRRGPRRARRSRGRCRLGPWRLSAVGAGRTRRRPGGRSHRPGGPPWPGCPRAGHHPGDDRSTVPRTASYPRREAPGPRASAHAAGQVSVRCRRVTEPRPGATRNRRRHSAQTTALSPQMSSRYRPLLRRPASQASPSARPVPVRARNTAVSASRTAGAMVLALPHT